MEGMEGIIIKEENKLDDSIKNSERDQMNEINNENI